MTQSEVDRRKRVIETGKTDLERWANASQLEESWEARAILAADFVPAGSRVLDIGCGAMKLEQRLPFGCSYTPCDVVRRDGRTIVADLNTDGIPEMALAECDLVVMLGVWEYLFQPSAVLTALARSKKTVLCSYCTVDSTTHLDRRALGWVNDFSLAEFVQFVHDGGYRVAQQVQVDQLQTLFKLTPQNQDTQPATKRVHVISYNNVGNFGDRLGYHLIADMLPAHAEVSWGTLRPFSPVPDALDLLVVGIGNSLFGDLLDETLLQATKKAKSAIGIFGTQYRELLNAGDVTRLLDRLDHWYARYEDDTHIYGRGRSNVSLLGDWLINAFPLAQAVDDRPLKIGKEIWQDLPLDRTIQMIQRHKRVASERLHPLLCALTSANDVAYREQREGGDGKTPSGKFRSMLMDVFGRTYPEGRFWQVDRRKVADYKARVRRNTEELKRHVAKLLG